jgi:hypothetical protein
MYCYNLPKRVDEVMAVFIIPRHVVTLYLLLYVVQRSDFTDGQYLWLGKILENLLKKIVSHSLLKFWCLLKEEALWNKMRFSHRTSILRDWRKTYLVACFKFRSQRLARMPRDLPETPTACFPICVEISDWMLFVWLLILCPAKCRRERQLTFKGITKLNNHKLI